MKIYTKDLITGETTLLGEFPDEPKETSIGSIKMEGDHAFALIDSSTWTQISPPKSPSWIMTDDQRNRLTSLAQEIALENDLSLSIHIDKDGLNIGLYSIAETEEEVEEE